MFCFGLGFALLVPIPRGRFYGIKPSRFSSGSFSFARMLYTWAAGAIYSIGLLLFELWESVTDYLLEATRPLADTYRQKSPNYVYQYESLNTHNQEIRLI